jgi:hypothetical protein
MRSPEETNFMTASMEPVIRKIIRKKSLFYLFVPARNAADI